MDDELAGFDPEWLRAKYRAERDKRIRRDGNQQYVQVADRFAAYGADPFAEPVEREPQNLMTDVLLIGRHRAESPLKFESANVPGVARADAVDHVTTPKGSNRPGCPETAETPGRFS